MAKVSPRNGDASYKRRRIPEMQWDKNKTHEQNSCGKSCGAGPGGLLGFFNEAIQSEVSRRSQSDGSLFLLMLQANSLFPRILSR